MWKKESITILLLYVLIDLHRSINSPICKGHSKGHQTIKHNHWKFKTLGLPQTKNRLLLVIMLQAILWYLPGTIDTYRYFTKHSKFKNFKFKTKPKAPLPSGTTTYITYVHRYMFTNVLMTFVVVR